MEVFDFTEEQVWGNGKNVPDERYMREAVEHLDFENGEVPKDHPEMGPLPRRSFRATPLTPRFALQTLGSWGRECYPNVWAEHTIRVAKQILEDGRGYSPNRGINTLGWSGGFEPKGVVIPDVRLKNEIAAVKKAGGWVVRIKRPGYDKPQWYHNTETEQLTIPDEEFNGLIFNDKDLKNLEREMLILAEVLK